MTADWIYSPEGLLSDHVLEVSSAGEIIDLRPRGAESDLIHYAGTLCPGMVNAHCHLELSMMHEVVPEQTAMAEFVRQIVSGRQTFSEAYQIETAEKAIVDMKQRGIVALGDISNLPLTAPVKAAATDFLSYTFVELLGLRSDQANQTHQQGQQTQTAFHPLPASISPHAPYSCLLYTSPSPRDS